jgi:S-layer protein (TIGR01567 family)
MKRMTLIMLTAMMVLFASAMTVSAAEVDVRGQVTNLGASQFSWNNSNFAGFYYDIDKNIGQETLTVRLLNPVAANFATNTLSDTADPATNLRGVVYTTSAQPKNFKYKPWGQYFVIGFLAEKYFAAYDETTVTPAMTAYQPAETASYPALKSKNDNLMTNEQISKVLMDTDTEVTITSDTPMKLGEGYVLNVKTIDIDGNKAYVELTKDGQPVETKVIQPSIGGANMADQTYYYKADLGDTKEVVQIAVHFKNAFRGSNTNIATIDGVFQISDKATPLKSEQQYDKMSIRTVNPTDMSVVMDNKDNQITLSKNKDTILMQNIYIKTADQDATAEKPLRYYVYKKYTAPGTYELRGSVTDLGKSQSEWDNAKFSGFYYDIDKNLGNEKLTFRLLNPVAGNFASNILSDTADAANNRGVVYTTSAQPKNFKFKPWGQYFVIGFLADRYFAAYDETTVTPAMTTYQPAETASYPALKSKNDNLMTNEQISKVLTDTDTEVTITSDTPLTLGEGYKLAITNVDVKGNKAYIELTKNGQTIDRKIVQPSIDGANMADQTYYYKADLGDTKEVVQIAVHFKNAFAGSDTSIATIDGVFQISDTATPLKSEQQYDKMSIRTVNPTDMSIVMDNKDNQITLSKNKNVVLMQNIYIKTADQDATDVQPLRYYIYKAATIEAANVTAPEPTVPPTEVANVTTAAKTAVENVTTAATTAATGAVAGAEGAAKAKVNETVNKTKEAAGAAAAKQPGFEGIFAITGLLAVAYLVLGRKQ